MNSIYAKSQKSFNDIGVEIGFGQNTVNFGNVSCIINPDYKDLYITPDFRINYRISLSNRFYAQVFLGLNEFGGIDDNDNIEFKFKTLEYGVLVQYLFCNFSYGIGYKNSKINSAKLNLASIEYNIDEWSVDNYGSIGLRATYLKNKFTIGIEAWIGSKKITNSQLIGFEDIYETHYRLMIGYFIM